MGGGRHSVDQVLIDALKQRWKRANFCSPSSLALPKSSIRSSCTTTPAAYAPISRRKENYTLEQVMLTRLKDSFRDYDVPAPHLRLLDSLEEGQIPNQLVDRVFGEAIPPQELRQLLVRRCSTARQSVSSMDGVVDTNRESWASRDGFSPRVYSSSASHQGALGSTLMGSADPLLVPPSRTPQEAQGPCDSPDEDMELAEGPRTPTRSEGEEMEGEREGDEEGMKTPQRDSPSEPEYLPTPPSAMPPPQPQGAHSHSHTRSARNGSASSARHETAEAWASPRLPTSPSTQALPLPTSAHTHTHTHTTHAPLPPPPHTHTTHAPLPPPPHTARTHSQPFTARKQPVSAPPTHPLLRRKQVHPEGTVVAPPLTERERLYQGLGEEELRELGARPDSAESSTSGCVGVGGGVGSRPGTRGSARGNSARSDLRAPAQSLSPLITRRSPRAATAPLGSTGQIRPQHPLRSSSSSEIPALRSARGSHPYTHSQTHSQSHRESMAWGPVMPSPLTSRQRWDFDPGNIRRTFEASFLEKTARRPSTSTQPQPHTPHTPHTPHINTHRPHTSRSTASCPALTHSHNGPLSPLTQSHTQQRGSGGSMSDRGSLSVSRLATNGIRVPVGLTARLGARSSRSAEEREIATRYGEQPSVPRHPPHIPRIPRGASPSSNIAPIPPVTEEPDYYTPRELLDFSRRQGALHTYTTHTPAHTGMQSGGGGTARGSVRVCASASPLPLGPRPAFGRERPGRKSTKPSLASNARPGDEHGDLALNGFSFHDAPSALTTQLRQMSHQLSTTTKQLRRTSRL